MRDRGLGAAVAGAPGAVRHAAQRAQRQYGTLWNWKIGWSPGPSNATGKKKPRAVEATEREYTAWQRDHRTAITPQDRYDILAIGEDVPQGWHADTTTPADRTHLLRLVVKEVLLDQKRLRGKVWLQINWQTGASTIHEIRLARRELPRA